MGNLQAQAQAQAQAAQAQVQVPVPVADPSPSQAQHSHQGPQMPKRPRLADRPELQQPLHIDVKKEPTYNPQVEAISPTLPADESNSRSSKDELLQAISRVDREISKVEQQILKLQKKQHQIEEETSKPPREKSEAPEISSSETKHQSIAQIIYAENRKKAEEAHSLLSKLGPKIELPLYNQPSDTIVYHENRRNHALFKGRLILHFKKRHQARRIRERYLTDRYDQLMQVWLKKMERVENNAKRKAKDAKMREYYEKIFPEIKKSREDKERFSRAGTRSGNIGPYARSEAEFEQIVDGLHEQEEDDKKMRSYAVIPPMMLDARQRSLRYLNNNGLIEDAMEECKERSNINVWTPQEKQIFKEKYLQHPKNFTVIQQYLERKTVADCVQYYYQTKRSENYKQLLRKQTVKKTKRLQKQQPAAPIKEEPKEEIEEPGSSVLPITGTAIPPPPEPTIIKKEEDKVEEDDSSDDNEVSTSGAGEGKVWGGGR
ncbi:nuclear receptor corepressor 1-like [Argopecten irradians]|uniref:nuclear receptor corepressor 1-like n=1 Tax=Argopecten irradians TaxID=31199 RepID=UPI00371FBBCB